MRTGGSGKGYPNQFANDFSEFRGGSCRSFSSTLSTGSLLRLGPAALRDVPKALAACFRRPPEPNPRSRSALNFRPNAFWQSTGRTFHLYRDGRDGRTRKIVVVHNFALFALAPSKQPPYHSKTQNSNHGIRNKSQEPDTSGTLRLAKGSMIWTV